MLMGLFSDDTDASPLWDDLKMWRDHDAVQAWRERAVEARRPVEAAEKRLKELRVEREQLADKAHRSEDGAVKHRARVEIRRISREIEEVELARDEALIHEEDVQQEKVEALKEAAADFNARIQALAPEALEEYIEALKAYQAAYEKMQRLHVYADQLTARQSWGSANYASGVRIHRPFDLKSIPTVTNDPEALIENLERSLQEKKQAA